MREYFPLLACSLLFLSKQRGLGSVVFTFEGVATTPGDQMFPISGGDFTGKFIFELGGVKDVQSNNQITGYYLSDTVSTVVLDNFERRNLTTTSFSRQSTIFFNRTVSDRLVSQVNSGGATVGLVIDFEPSSFGPLVPLDPLILNGLTMDDVIASEVSFNPSGGDPSFGILTDFNVIFIPEAGSATLVCLAFLPALIVRRRARH